MKIPSVRQGVETMTDQQTQYKVVEASEVCVGDYLYNGHEKHDAFKWSRVIDVRLIHGCAVISTFEYSAWKHPREAVAIKVKSVVNPGGNQHDTY